MNKKDIEKIANTGAPAWASPYGWQGIVATIVVGVAMLALYLAT